MTGIVTIMKPTNPTSVSMRLISVMVHLFVLMELMRAIAMKVVHYNIYFANLPAFVWRRKISTDHKNAFQSTTVNYAANGQ